MASPARISVWLCCTKGSDVFIDDPLPRVLAPAALAEWMVSDGKCAPHIFHQTPSIPCAASPRDYSARAGEAEHQMPLRMCPISYYCIPQKGGLRFYHFTGHNICAQLRDQPRQEGALQAQRGAIDRAAAQERNVLLKSREGKICYA